VLAGDAGCACGVWRSYRGQLAPHYDVMHLFDTRRLALYHCFSRYAGVEGVSRTKRGKLHGVCVCRAESCAHCLGCLHGPSCPIQHAGNVGKLHPSQNKTLHAAAVVVPTATSNLTSGSNEPRPASSATCFYKHIRSQASHPVVLSAWRRLIPAMRFARSGKREASVTACMNTLLGCRELVHLR
jgi:hypothetical protein